MRNKLITVPQRRRREGKTNYLSRRKMLTGKKPRLIVRKRGRTIIAQVVSFTPTGDKTHVNVSSKQLSKLGWEYHAANTPAAYLTGYLAGKEALKQGVKEAVLDLGMQESSSKLFAVLKGAADAGLQVPHDEAVLPNEDRISGEHISGLADKALSKSQFAMLKDKKALSKMKESVQTIKTKLDK